MLNLSLKSTLKNNTSDNVIDRNYGVTEDRNTPQTVLSHGKTLQARLTTWVCAAEASDLADKKGVRDPLARSKRRDNRAIAPTATALLKSTQGTSVNTRIERIIVPNQHTHAVIWNTAKDAMTDSKKKPLTPAEIRQARMNSGLTQMEAAQKVQASLRGWQQWEAGDRAMPLGLFELFMLKTRQWLLDNDVKR